MKPRGPSLDGKRTTTVVVLWLLACLLGAPAEAGYFIEVQFFGGIDIASFETWAWREGQTAASFEAEQSIRATVEERMGAKGYRRVAADPDCYLVTRVVRDEGFPAGVLKVEAVEAASGDLAWQGTVTGYVASSNPKKVAKTVRRALKKLFKQFPKSRSAP